VVGWFTNGGLTPHYNEPNEAWTDWARDNQWNSRVSAFVMLLAGFVFLHFMGTIRSMLGCVNAPARGSEQLARVAFGGAVTGMAGMAMASVMLAAASTNGADVDPVVSKSVATASGGPFLIAAMGFAAFLIGRRRRLQWRFPRSFERMATAGPCSTTGSKVAIPRLAA
jgi:hypothetical protein